MYIQANIGRNITTNLGVRPMGDIAWETFQKDVKDEIFLAVHDEAPEVAVEIEWEDIQVHTGVGEWQGVAEESAHVSVYVDHDGTRYAGGGWVSMYGDIRDNLAKRLSYLARQYGQDAIAFIVTDSYLASR